MASYLYSEFGRCIQWEGGIFEKSGGSGNYFLSHEARIRNRCLDLYKFVSPGDEKYFSIGSIQFRKLSYYRNLEKKWIGDPMEGRVNVFIDRMESAKLEPNDPSGMHVIGRSVGRLSGLIAVPTGVSSNAIIQNVGFDLRCKDVFIWCASLGPLSLLRETWAKYSDAGYDNATPLGINDIKDLFNYLVEDGSIEIDGSAKKFKDIFQYVHMGIVQYKERSGLYGVVDLNSASPFIKEKEFSWQREFRIILTPYRDDLPHTLKIEIGRNKLFRVY